MTGRKQKSTVSWSDVKTRLTDFDRAGLIGLIQDLYAASRDNRAFLHLISNDGQPGTQTVAVSVYCKYV